MNNMKVLVSLVIAALLLVGCAAPVPGGTDNAAPAIQQDNAMPISNVETPITDANAPADTTPVETAPIETQPPVTEPPATEPAPAELSKDEAVAVALEHAKLDKSQVTELKAKKDRDDGRVEWEIEFRSGDYEYDYTVHAETGKVLEHDKEYDPIKTEPAPVAILTADEAVAIALDHAGLKLEDVKALEKELDDEEPKWEVEFKHGKTEYSYTIHSETGKILEWDKEIDD